MTLPEHLLLKRRLQILDDTTRDAHRSGTLEPDGRAPASGDTFEDSSQDSSQDSWVKNFMSRLAGLVRHLDSRK